MQLIIILALLVATLAWLSHAYHQLSVLYSSHHDHWLRCALLLKERNAALREFTYLIAIHESGHDCVLRRIRKIQGDLDINISHGDVPALIEDERCLQLLLARLLSEVVDRELLDYNQSLKRAFQLLNHYQQECTDSIRLYNESVLRYNQGLERSGNSLLAHFFHFYPGSPIMYKELED